MLAALATSYCLYLRNSLLENGRWFPTKARIINMPVSALPFWMLGQSVAEDRLDLSAWQGFHEVLYTEAAELDSVAFNVRLDRGGWASLVLEDPRSGERRGIKVAAAAGATQIAFSGPSSGRFLVRKTWLDRPLEAGRWYRVEVAVNRQRLTISLDGTSPVAVPLASASGALRVGFRGGASQALIDDVIMQRAGGAGAIKEDFSNGRHALPIFALLLALLAALSYAIRLRREGPRRAAMAAVGLHLIAALSLGALYGFEYKVRSHRYPEDESGVLGTLVEASRDPRIPAALRRHLSMLLGKLKFSGDPEMDGPDPEYFKQKLRGRYPMRPSRDVTRVLFVGTSQTHGDGVSIPEKTFVGRLERLLNTRRAPGSLPFQCINAALPNTVSRPLLDFYREELVRLGPDLAVINLGNNDQEHPQGFAEDLEGFVRASKKHGVRLLLSLEADAVDCSGSAGLATHKVTRKIAAREGVDLVDLHGYMVKNGAAGFLWWDCVHFSELGHELAAELFAKQILARLRPGAAPQVSLAPAAPVASDRGPGPARCDQIRGESRCTELTAEAQRLLGPDFHAGTCLVGDGQWGAGKCSDAGRAARCAAEEGMTTFLYSSGGAPYTEATARRACAELIPTVPGPGCSAAQD